MFQHHHLFDLLSCVLLQNTASSALFALSLLPRRLHLHGYSSALFTALVLLPVHTVQPIFLTVSFPTSSFCSISPCDLPSMVPPTLPAPPPPNCVYAACVLFVSSTCHSETHCFMYGTASHTPKHSRTADCRRDAAAEDHTRLSKGPACRSLPNSGG